MIANMGSYACGNSIKARFCLNGYTIDTNDRSPDNMGGYSCTDDAVAFDAEPGTMEASGLEHKNLIQSVIG